LERTPNKARTLRCFLKREDVNKLGGKKVAMLTLHYYYKEVKYVSLSRKAPKQFKEFISQTIKIKGLTVPEM